MDIGKKNLKLRIEFRSNNVQLMVSDIAREPFAAVVDNLSKIQGIDKGVGLFIRDLGPRWDANGKVPVAISSVARVVDQSGESGGVSVH